MKRIDKAINEGLDRALISFEGEVDFNKSSKLDNSMPDRIIANSIVDDCIRNCSMTIDQYVKIVNDAYYPVKDKELLKDLCNITMNCAGNECDLNWIDTSGITSMASIFMGLKSFNGDISNWNVSNVTNMCFMFWGSEFNGDISGWDVSNVTDMRYMFNSSEFNGDISRWNVSNVTDMHSMFESSKFNGDISRWNVSNVTTMSGMFHDSKFDGDISNWDVSNVKIKYIIFDDCPIKEKYKPKFNC